MNSLTNILKGYPSFQPNQVLTSTHLNSLAHYLEQQDRLSRQKLIGIGIVCGLEVNLNSGTDTKVIINNGVGITSQGFLISLKRSEYTHVRPYHDPAQYSHFINPDSESSYPLLELLDSPGLTNDETIERLSDEHIQDKVVVLYLEILEVDTDKCLDESCDEKGKRWQFEVRKLLIDQEVMETIIRESLDIPSNDSLGQHFNPEYNLSSFELERFGFNDDNGRPHVRLDNIHNMDSFVNAYHPAVISGGRRAAQALHDVYSYYQTLFEHQLGSISNPFAGYDNSTNNPFVRKLERSIDESPLNIQDLYNFLHDIKDSYDELIEKLFKLNSLCCPNENLFPRHLMLGKLKHQTIGQFDPENYAQTDTFRHHFIPSPIHLHQEGLLTNIKQLIQRLVLMCESFKTNNIDSNEPIKITPSKDCKSSIGQRALPYYYNLETSQSIYNYWNFDDIRRNRSGELLGYHSNIYNLENGSPINPQVAFPLAYDLCKYPKLRIEGHIGLPLIDAVEKLRKLRYENSLPFDIITLKLDSTLGNIQLADDSIIADIQAQYLVQRNEVVCCVRDTISILERVKNVAPFMILVLLYSSFKSVNSPGASFNPAIGMFILNLFKQFYMLYIDVLKDLVDELPLDIKNFNLEEFSEAHTLASSMSSLIKYAINTWGDIEAIFIDDNKEREGKQNRLISSDTLSIILNYFELFIDRILDDCLLARFKTLYNLYIHRLETHAIFSEFSKYNTGIEHISGVQKGGTFILVYEDKIQKKEVTGVVTDLNGKPIAEAQILSATRPYVQYGTSNKKGEYKIDLPKKEQSLRIKMAGYYNHRTNVDKTNNIVNINLESRRQPTTELMATQAAEEKRDQLRNNFGLIMGKIDESSIEGIERIEGIKEFIYEKESQASATQLQVVNVSADKEFRVVGDFYLPGRISAYFPEIDLRESCPQSDKRKMIDLEKITQELKERLTSSEDSKLFLNQANLSSFMGGQS